MELMENFGTYTHARPNGEAFYVGKGRRARAFNLAARNPHHGNIVAKDGAENIIVDFVPCESEEAAFNLEINWIKTLRLFGAKLTNRTDGGEGASGLVHSDEAREKMSTCKKGKVASPETRAKLSSIRKGNTYSLGHKHTDATKEKMSASQKGNTNMNGKTHTDATKAKMSAARKGNTNGLGHTHSDATKAKMSHGRIGNTNTKGNTWINCGTVRRQIKAGEEIPVGWKRGMLIAKQD